MILSAGANYSARLEASYLLKTDDETPAFIAVRSEGWRTGPREVMERLMDPELMDQVRPEEYKFRLSVGLETGDERYDHVNHKMWMGVGAKMGSRVVYDAYLM